ncbi:STAS domain-containing protein [Treponema phagedenis]|uniref:STAS domain-containing protein n=1 Tax=Treponema phagedenis TaxID=162 RepID=UPI0011E78B54|nr:STAS domain-containing protein [Treponema phagedenis]QEJ95625.1 STAS domain-containing protein [Treponema phagedenis]QKS92842.1 STAS domain-containing protein [Treponema phagedenis]
MESVQITEKITPDYILLSVVGSINSYTYQEFESKIYSSIKENNIVLELSNVTNMSSSGLGVLMSAHDEGEEHGHKLYILAPSEIVRLAIDSTGFSEMLPSFTL